MHAFAQTNFQLINQLRNSGYPPAELKFVAYRSLLSYFIDSLE